MFNKHPKGLNSQWIFITRVQADKTTGQLNVLQWPMLQHVVWALNASSLTTENHTILASTFSQSVLWKRKGVHSATQWTIHSSQKNGTSWELKSSLVLLIKVE